MTFSCSPSDRRRRPGLSFGVRRAARESTDSRQLRTPGKGAGRASPWASAAAIYGAADLYTDRSTVKGAERRAAPADHR